MRYLAIDVGGTSTRAAVVDEHGNCAGYSVAGSGNPTSSDPDSAAASIISAGLAAMAEAGSTPGDVARGVIGIAGATRETGDWLLAEVVRAGLPKRLTLEPDLLAAYHSGSLAADGYALVAGTGAAAVRIRGGRIEATRDGLGWLLGDAGSGFWIGHCAVRAATSALDDRGPPTVLVSRILALSGGSAPTEELDRYGRLADVRRIMDDVYRGRPVELARFAPLVFEAADTGDDVARGILADAADALATTLAAVVVADIAGPLVLAGSILSQRAAVAEGVIRSFSAGGHPPVVTVPDGLVGAAVMALRDHGVPVTDDVFDRLRASLTAQP